MQRLRQATVLARLVLVWFALAIGVAVAAPLVHPQDLQLVCSAGGTVKLIAQDADSGQPSSVHTLDCPLCATMAAPPPFIEQAHALAAVTALAAGLVSSVRIAALTSPPLPARGPPSRRIAL
ncbi:MAG: hypothetical protein ACAH21_05160 [Ramlibacter sp.]|nr:hypothetical protein [Ramlibacter sp.]